jgi:hypothetical protein
MASVLFRYQTSERMDDQSLAALLLISPQQLTRLALCKRPTPSLSFAEQVQHLAAFSGAEAGRLAGIIRQVDALAALQVTPAMNASEVQSDITNLRQVGWLAAARDRNLEADQSKGIDSACGTKVSFTKQ